jgi:carboxylesterase type B
VGQFGSRHGIDWPFTFDTLAGGGGPVPLGPNPPQALADTLNGAWMRFVRGRHVGHGWRPYDPERPTAMIFDAESHVEKRDALGDLRGFWRRSRSGIDLGAPWVWPSP